LFIVCNVQVEKYTLAVCSETEMEKIASAEDPPTKFTHGDSTSISFIEAPRGSGGNSVVKEPEYEPS
jgi:hypothetical protein